jgi:hypothetical protein
MTPYLALKIPNEYLHLHDAINRVIARLPDLDLGRDEKGDKIVLSCHMLARAIGKVFRLKVVDGHFAGRFAHSWLMTDDLMWIIDLYPVGIMPLPLIVDAGGAFTPGHILYKKRRKFCKLLSFSSIEFRRSVKLLVREIRKLVAS